MAVAEKILAPGAPRAFFAIRTDMLLDNTQVNFDVYALPETMPSAPRSEDYILYAKAPYRWTLRELNELMRMGMIELFVDEAERPAFLRYMALHETPKIDLNLEPRFRIKQIQDVGSHLVEAAFLCEIDDTLKTNLGVISTEMVRCLQEDPSSVQQIQMLCDHSVYTYIHSASVAALVPAIAMTMGEKDPNVLASWSLAGLLHDIGKRHIPLQILDKGGPLTPEEWAVMKSHADLGVQTVQGIDFPDQVTQVIALHHEKLDGSGYPHGIIANEIPSWVQIATVADIFSALTTTRCYHYKRSRFEALMFMKHELRGKVNKDAFKALVEALVVDKKEGGEE
jgi:putative nucleotidyltransferase with HDIG domain